RASATRRALRALLLSSNRAAPPAPPTLPLHDALPICPRRTAGTGGVQPAVRCARRRERPASESLRTARERAPRKEIRLAPRAVLDRKSTRLNSSHLGISYAVFCLKKKKKPSILRSSLR